ncbi:hypothetical protein F4823DRAFT_331222 [Ustulina deusta]|nr:hypothetical protein F4823DRAFT_331222 [Ustulina deusta]
MEVSQRGLFRALLFQRLTKRPSLIPWVTPRVWGAWCLFGWPKEPFWRTTSATCFTVQLGENPCRGATRRKCAYLSTGWTNAMGIITRLSPSTASCLNYRMSGCVSRTPRGSY